MVEQDCCSVRDSIVSVRILLFRGVLLYDEKEVGIFSSYDSYQNQAAAETYGSLGYLASLATLLACGWLPLAKYIQNLLVSLIAVSLSAIINLIALISGLKARRMDGYMPPESSSASQRVVCAVWLLVQIYAASYYKSAYPQYGYAALSYEIIAIVATTSGADYTMITEATTFIRTILLNFLTGFAITSFVVIALWPVTCRKIALNDMKSYIESIRSVLMAQIDYMAEVEKSSVFPRSRPPSVHSGENQVREYMETEIVATAEFQNPSPEAGKLKHATDKLLTIQSKLTNDMVFAKREISWGIIGPGELSEVAKLLSDVTRPLVGLSSIMDILDRVAKLHGWESHDEPEEEYDLELMRQQTVVVKEWQSLMKILKEPFHDMTEIMFRANEHVIMKLSLRRPRKHWSRKEREQKPEDDVEAVAQPTEKDFASQFEGAIQVLFAGRKAMVNQWCTEQGVDLSLSLNAGARFQDLGDQVNMHKLRENHRQLLILLYVRSPMSQLSVLSRLSHWFNF